VGDLVSVISVPAATALASVGSYPVSDSTGTGSAVTVDEVETQKSTSEPEDSREKGKCNISLPFLAATGLGDVAPVEDGTAVKRTDEGNEKTECNNPEDEEGKVNRPMDEATSEWKKPEESKED